MKPYHFSTHIFLRTPLIPIQDIKEEQSLTPSILESLYIASPDFYKELTEGQKDLTIPLIKYLARATFRCTPFGLFAGCSLVKWGQETAITFNGAKRHTRLDMFYLHELAKHLGTQSEIMEQMKYFPNNSLYKAGDRLRYIEFNLKEHKRFYNLSAVVRMEELDNLLAWASEGATIADLAQKLKSEDITEEEASHFIKQLIESQLLVSEMEPAVTGKEFLHQLLDTLTNLKQNATIVKIIHALKEIDDKLKQLDNEGVNQVESYKHILTLLAQLPVAYQENRVFQTDLFKTTQSGFLAENLKKTLHDALNVLVRFATLRNYKLEQFAQSYQKRYEKLEMPLLEVLDPENGLGYPIQRSMDTTPLIKEIVLPESTDKTLTLDNKNEWLLQILLNAVRLKQYAVELSDKDIEGFTPGWDKLPPSFSIMFRITDFTKETLFIELAGGSSAANLLGRFAHADQEIETLISDIAKEEQNLNPDVLFAEIVHLPENRTGNVLLHPVFRDYEIPYLSASSLEQEKQILLEDLYVSVQGNHIRLRSKKLNKEIIPRLSNAHNYSRSELPVYQFLCDLQHQNILTRLTFSWGNIANQFLFLPRVVYKNAILHLATWQLPNSEWASLLKVNDAGRSDLLQEFRQKWSIPQYIVLAEGDNELFVDFENNLTVKALLHSIKNRERIILKEFLFDPETPVKDNHGGRYVNQFVASVINKNTVYKANTTCLSNHSVSAVQRTFKPGSEWAYFKYYCGSKTADLLLTDAIRPMAEQLLSAGIIDKWFFIRYNDPQPHLRVRFHLKDLKEISRILELNHHYFANNELLWSNQMDTYTRELERYGSEAIEHAENIFYHDSQAIVDFLNNTFGEGREAIRWLWGIRSIDELLNCFHFTAEDKVNLMKSLKESFAREFKLEKPSRLEIDKKFRTYRNEIENILNPSLDHKLDWASLITLIQTTSVQIVPIAKELIDSTNNGKSSIPISDLVSSYIHMHLNRLLPHSQRLHELVIYDFMYRHYQSKQARIPGKDTIF